MKKNISRILLHLQYKKRFSNYSPLKLFNFLLKSQYWQRDELEAYQLLRINKLLKIASVNTDLYHGRFDTSSIPLMQLGELLKIIPRLTKEDIKKNKDLILNKKKIAFFKYKTSGSTGRPMSIYVSKLAAADRLARLMRFLSWWDVKIYDRNILLWGTKESDNSTRNKLKNWVKNRKIIDTLNLTDHSINELYSNIIKYRPVYIRGYTSSLLQLAKLLDKNGLILKKDRLRLIIITAEMLFEEDREFIEKVFNCRVANEYGAAELGVIANECPEGSMHLNEESIYINTDKKNNVIATDLYNYAMPLINYENEDRVQLSNKVCKCGRNGRVISNIQGRYSDFIKCPDGSEKGQVLFYYLFQELEKNGFANCIDQYKIYQKGMHFNLEIVPGIQYDDAVSGYLKSRMQERIGKEITIELIVVSEIKREPSGKLRFFVNLGK